MHTARSQPAIVSTSDGEYLIVIGGYVNDGSWTAVVELFQVKSRRWFQLRDLPGALRTPSATICGDQLNVIGGYVKGYSCSLRTLPSTDQPIISPLTLSWKPLPRLPVEESTVSTLCGQLVLIGGMLNWLPVNSIHQLVDRRWVKIGSMASGRYNCLVASQSPDKIIIIGGYSKNRQTLNIVEECAVCNTV